MSVHPLQLAHTWKINKLSQKNEQTITSQRRNLTHVANYMPHREKIPFFLPHIQNSREWKKFNFN